MSILHFSISRSARVLAAVLAVVGMAVAVPRVVQAKPRMPTAITASQPDGFIKDLGNQAITLLKDKTATKADRKAYFAQLLKSNFDLTTIGRFVLGRYWNVATPAEQKEYTELFQEMVVRVYTQRFDNYAGQQFTVVSATPLDERDTMVKSNVEQPDGAEPVIVEWRVRKVGGSMKIVDVVVEGISMSVTQRSDFASVIEQSGGQMSALLANLKTRIAKAD